MFTDKGTFTNFQYLKLGDDIEGTLCGYNGEIQQFIGLKDKNGKEIYEEDIIETPSGIWLVKWYQENCKFRAIQKQYQAELVDNTINYKIIGNIYKNQELLTH